MSSFLLTLVLLFPHLVPAQIDTTYITGGEITQDSTWTKAQSPYVLSGDVQINEGVTLTIEPGVRVLFERYDENNMQNPGRVDLLVNGTLKAVGTETDSIYFEDINGERAYNSWSSIVVYGNADLRYAVIKHACHGGLHLLWADSVAVTNSLFSSCNQGIQFQHQNSKETHDNIKVEYNTFIDNDISIVYETYFGACLIQYNDFYSSYHSDIVVEWWWNSGGNFSAHYNNFHNTNDNTIIDNHTLDPVDMRYNYWGPAATDEMNTGDNPKDISRIEDYYNDDNRGKVDYAHWLDAPWPEGQAVDGNYSAELLITDSQYQEEMLTYHTGETIYIQVTDPDGNADNLIPEQITLDVWSELETTHETVTLNETDLSTGVFQGYIPLDDALGAPTADGQLQVNHGDWMYFRYIDPANDWGQVDTVLYGRVYDLTVTSGHQINSAVTWTVAGGPYLLTGDVQINQGGSLTIEPGVRVYFEPYCDDNDWRSERDLSEIFVMGGVLTAVGTVTDSIIFQSYDPSPKHSQWYGISFSGASEAGSIIQYARIEGGGLSIDYGSPQVLNVLVKNNVYGIHICGGSSATPLIRNCIITQSIQHGIVTVSHAVIENNDIYDNPQGIYIHANGNRELIRYNNIYDNWDAGISFGWGSSADTIRITGNNIHDNGGNGVTVNSQHLVRLRNNNIYANNNWEIDIQPNRYSQVDARSNYWGPEATAEMNTGGNPKDIAAIWDYFDDPGLGMVNYAHWLDAPWPDGNPAPGGYTGELNFIHSDGTDARGYSEGDTLFLRLYDPDLNLDINTPEAAQVEVWSGLETTPEILDLNEVEADAGLFRGWMLLDGVSGYPMTDGVLQVDVNNWIRAAYSDALDDWLGTAAISDSVQYNPRIKEYESDEHTVLLLHFDEGSGQVVNDASSYANHGYLGWDAGEEDNDAHWSSRGIAGSCLYFDGVSSFLRIPHDPSLNITGTEITIEMWVNFPSVSPDDWLVSKGDDYNYRSIGLYLGDNRVFRSQFVIDNEATSWGLNPNHPIELNRWYHIALTYNGSAMKFYIDGDSVGVQQYAGELTPSENHPLFFGENAGANEYAEVYMDEVRISNIARTSFNLTGEGLPPGKVADLAVVDSTSNSIILQWHAPGADSYTGTALRYDLRRSTSPIDSANFALADSVTSLPDPEPAGTLQQFTVTGLAPSTTYYFALKAVDDEGLWSPISDVASATTEPQDLTAPGTIANLAVAEAGKRQVVLTWTAPADDGQSGRPTRGYSIHYSTAPITEASFFAADSAAPPVPASPGTIQTATVTGLDPSTTYYFAVKAYDEVPHWSAISNVRQTTTLAVPVLAGGGWPSFHGDSRNSGCYAGFGATEDSLHWSYATGGQIASSPVVDEQGNVYFGSEDGNLYSLTSQGQLRWKQALGGGIFAAPVLATEGYLYIGAKSNVFHCLTQDSGQTVWSHTAGGQIYSSAIVSGRGIVYFGSLDSNLYALQSEDGLKVWSFATGSKVYNSPALSVDESVVYFGTQGGKLYATDARSGSKLWEFDAASPVYSSPAVDSAGTIYFAAQNGHVYALDQNGSKTWEFETGSSIFYSSPALQYVSTGQPRPATYVCIGTDNGKLYCLNAATGAEIWSFPTAAAEPIRNAPLVASNALIYFGAADSIFYCVDTTGTLQWSHKVGGVLYTSSPAIAPSGQIYIGSYDYRLYSLGYLDVFMLLISGMTQDEYGGDIEIPYSIINPAGLPVSLFPEYTIDEGETWHTAAVTGDTTGIGPDSYNGSIVWNSASPSDLPGADLPAVRFKLEPYDKDSTGIAGITPTFHLDNNALPVITAGDVIGEQSGDIAITFTYSDAEDDTLALTGEYQRLGTAIWSPATFVGDVDTLTGTEGQVVWPTLADLPDSSGHYYLRLLVHDNDPSEPDTLTLHVDNYHLQAIALTPLPAEQSGSVSIDYLLTDTSQDTLDLICEYRLPEDTVWSAANVSGDTTNIGSAGYDGSVTWLSTQNLPGWDIQGVLFKITPDDDWALGTADSISLHIDNNAPPTAALDSIIGERTGVVPIVFNLTDPESDTLSLTAEYRLLGAQEAWETATTSAALTGITDYSDTLFWDSDADLTEFIGYINFRLTPADNDPGQAATVRILIDQIGAAVVVALSTPKVEQTGDVAISFTLTDDEGDEIDLKLEYSLDGGSTWEEGTISGQTTGLTVSEYSDTLTWHSGTDLPGVDNESVLLKLTPWDGYHSEILDLDIWGAYLITEPFHLDNNLPPVITSTLPYQEVFGDVSLPYLIIDQEADTVDIAIQYSTDRMATWKEITTDHTLTGIVQENYLDTLVWNSTRDLPSVDLDSVWLLLSISDNDPGVPDTVVVHLDNEVGPMVIQTAPLAQARHQWNDAIRVVFSTPIQSSTLSGNLLLSGTLAGSIEHHYTVADSILTILPAQGLVALDTISVRLSCAITCQGGIPLDGNANGDRDGSPDDDYTWSFTVAGLGDYDLDGSTGFTDLVLFREAWFAKPQLLACEIAPFTGEVPHLQVIPDGKLDVQDLAVLARMWNWSVGLHKQTPAKVIAKASDQASPFILTAAFDGDNWTRLSRRGFALELALENQPMPTAFELKLAFDPDVLRYEGFTPLGNLEKKQDDWLILEYYDEESGLLLLTAVDFSTPDGKSAPTNIVGRLEMKVLTKGETEVVYNWAITRAGGISTLQRGQDAARISTAPPVPDRFALNQNYPNPFNPTTTIRIEVPQESAVALVVYDLLGRERARLADGHLEPGYHQVVWNGKDRAGRELPSGVYIVRLLTPEYARSIKLVLLK